MADQELKCLDIYARIDVGDLDVDTSDETNAAAKTDILQNDVSSRTSKTAFPSRSNLNTKLFRPYQVTFLQIYML